MLGEAIDLARGVFEPVPRDRLGVGKAPAARGPGGVALQYGQAADEILFPVGAVAADHQFHDVAEGLDTGAVDEASSNTRYSSTSTHKRRAGV